MKAFSKLISLVAFLIAIVGFVLCTPFIYHYLILNTDIELPYFNQVGLNKNLISPVKVNPFSTIDEQTAYQDRWRDFHMNDIYIPLPTRNPLFEVIPILKYENEKTEFGLKFFGTEGREIARVYLLENRLFDYELDEQELFKIPLIEKMLLEIPLDRIWRDIFERDLQKFPTNYGGIVYNLYLYQIRNLLFPKNALGIGKINKENTGVVNLKSPNKDFQMELISTNENELIYSYILVTARGEPESQKIRNYFLERIKFQRGSQEIADIIYKEFKSLEFSRQAHQEGMLYLLSAWTHWKENEQFMRQMVELSERSNTNDEILAVIYAYSLKRYGRTFSLREDTIGLKDPEMELERRIELEKLRKDNEKTQEIFEKAPPRQTQEELLLERLKEAKKRKKSGNKIRFD
jgi:hypothetical protein